MARQKIPGLTCMSADNEDETDSVPLYGFNLKSFTVPGSHRFGNCRRVTEFQKLRTISEGTFGTVYKVKDTLNNENYALKKLAMPDGGRENPQVLPQNFLRQINNLKILNHINIVNLKEVVVGTHFENNYLVLDLCEYSLENVIEQVDMVFLQHKQIKNIMLQLLYGLEYLHRFKVIHRDLCPKNILFTETGILKISDFASSRKETHHDMTPDLGKRWYRAPEMLFGSLKYTTAADIWAVGCIFAEMLRQRPLLTGSTDGDVIRSMIHMFGTPNERTWPGFSGLPVPRRFHLRRQPYNRLRPTFPNQSILTIEYLIKILKYNPAVRPSAESLQRDNYYCEYPHRCTNEELIKTLRASDRL